MTKMTKMTDFGGTENGTWVPVSKNSKKQTPQNPQLDTLGTHIRPRKVT